MAKSLNRAQQSWRKTHFNRMYRWLENSIWSNNHRAGRVKSGKVKRKMDERYPLAIKPWIVHWENVSTFFEFSLPIRRIIYTTNAVESLHRQFRKVTKNKVVFPTYDALFNMLFLAARDISKKWTMPHREWKTVVSNLAFVYGERLGLEID